MSDNTTINKIKSGSQTALSQTYQAYRNEFIAWAQKNFNCSEEDAKEAYQVSFFVFYDNVLSGKLQQITSSIKTYLFAIGKYKIYEQNRYVAKNQYEYNHELIEVEDHSNELIEKETKYYQIEKGLEQIGSPCKDILTMVYYENRSMDYITETLFYKNVSTTKNQKYKCMQRLKKIVAGIKV